MRKQETTRFSIEVHTTIRAGIREVWSLLVDPARLGRLYWDSTVESDFTPGHSIVWKGTWEGKPFEDRGTILQVKPPSLLQYSHWAPSFGADTEENRNLLTWELAEEGGAARVTFRHGNIATQEMKDHSEPMWKMLLDRMKDQLEKTEQPRP
jgi:uncharacterized protein YndB with AHSA1/START domain